MEKVYCGKWWWWERGSYLCIIRGELEDGGDGKVTYVGGLRKCIMLKEGTGIKEVRKMVTEITSNDLSEHKLWFE